MKQIVAVIHFHESSTQAGKVRMFVVISGNICAGGVWDKASGFWNMSIGDKARSYLTMEGNIVSPDSQVEDSLSKSFILTDPMFTDKADPERGQFRLKSDSPALLYGFKQIPFEKTGPYQSENRASWPFKMR
jgi:hypothetical protein